MLAMDVDGEKTGREETGRILIVLTLECALLWVREYFVVRIISAKILDTLPWLTTFFDPFHQKSPQYKAKDTEVTERGIISTHTSSMPAPEDNNKQKTTQRTLTV